MGQLADDMVDGRSCSHCGVYFEKEHGFPVLCTDCFEEDGEFTDLPKATQPEL